MAKPLGALYDKPVAGGGPPFRPQLRLRIRDDRRPAGEAEVTLDLPPSNADCLTDDDFDVLATRLGLALVKLGVLPDDSKWAPEPTDAPAEPQLEQPRGEPKVPYTCPACGTRQTVAGMERSETDPAQLVCMMSTCGEPFDPDTWTPPLPAAEDA